MLQNLSGSNDNGTECWVTHWMRRIHIWLLLSDREVIILMENDEYDRFFSL